MDFGNYLKILNLWFFASWMDLSFLIARFYIFPQFLDIVIAGDNTHLTFIFIQNTRKNWKIKNISII